MMPLPRQQRGLSPAWRAAALLLTVLLAPAAADAHPVPRDCHDRTIVVEVTPEPLTRQLAVTVRYRLEVDELTVVLDDMAPFRDEVQYDRFKNKPNEYYAEFTRIYAPLLAGRLDAQLDGRALKFTCAGREHRKTDETGQPLGHLRCDFLFRATAPLPRRWGGPQTLTFREGNYELQKGQVLLFGYFGSALAVLPQRGLPALLLAADGTWSVQLLNVTAPDAVLQARPPQDYRPGDEEKLRRLALQFCLVVPTRIETPTAAEDSPGGPTFGPLETVRQAIADTVRTAAEAQAAAAEQRRLQFAAWRQSAIKASFGAAEGAGRHPMEEPADDIASMDLLHLFLSSERGVAVLLLLAGLIGAAHALTPGHGKTLVAAYLVGQRGTVSHALILGLVTTVTHTGVVLLLALGLMFVSEDRRQQVANSLGLVLGLALVGLGLWLLLQRLAGRADHFHVGGHHHHHHHHDGDDHHHHHHHAPAANQKLGWYGLIVMGMTGGIAPCWDAVAMLVVAIGMNLLWLAVPMLLAFSAGLAAVLVLIGVLVVHARRFLDGRWSDSRVVKLLPIFSALFITAMGVLVCVQGMQATGHDHPPAKVSHR
jgi:ABC-type nickel/cobalt efflux system permease component RcnA